MSFGEIVIGANWGDEGKGTIVDYFCGLNPVDYVIRFSGGPQAAHNVVTDDGREHTFAQFGSGTFHGAKTILASTMLVNPFNMAVEADHLEPLIGFDPFNLMFVSENSLLITPLHTAANRQREINRGVNAHGSCGEGIGECRAYAELVAAPMKVGDIAKKDKSILRDKLVAYNKYLTETLPNFTFNGNIDDIVTGYRILLEDRSLSIVSDEWIKDKIAGDNHIVFEGSQGILLDEYYGFHPHTTWSSVVAKNALKLIEDSGADTTRFKRIGVTRTYATRHGFGPFPTEFDGDDWSKHYPEKHNSWGRFQGSWRAGLLDLVVLKYAALVNGGFDEVAVTHCDIDVEGYVEAYEGVDSLTPIEIVDERYSDLETALTDVLNSVKGKYQLRKVENLGALVGAIEEALDAPVTVLSYGPRFMDKVPVI